MYYKEYTLRKKDESSLQRYDWSQFPNLKIYPNTKQFSSYLLLIFHLCHLVYAPALKRRVSRVNGFGKKKGGVLFLLCFRHLSLMLFVELGMRETDVTVGHKCHLIRYF